MQRIIVLGLGLLIILATRSVADENETRPFQRVDFKNNLIPVLTKHGCNAGTCHGAAIGRGGFKLSLYGGDPTSDYEAIVRQVEGRRINLSDANQSLIVLKPTEYVEHGGGSLFDDDSESAHLLINWIKQGAGSDSHRCLQHVEITPKRYVSKSPGERITLRAVAFYSDGGSQDVTRWTIFQAEDASAVEIGITNHSHTHDGNRGTQAGSQFARAHRRGRHIVIARYLNEVVPIEIIVPLTDSRVDLADEARNNFIDDEILDSLEILGLPVAPIVDDAAFLRRSSLDLTGRLPLTEHLMALAEKSSFSPAATPETRPMRSAEASRRTAGGSGEQRAKLIDELLGSDAFNEYWTLQLAKLLRIRPQGPDEQGAFLYHRWLADQVRDQVSYQRLAHTMIMSTGDTRQNGPANFYRTTAGPREQAEFMSELFMGSRLRCRDNCHNHPLDRWTQDDYHGLAAIFAKVEGGKVVREMPNGAVIHPRTMEPATLRLPGERFLANDATDGRRQLADWLTDPTNPYFAKAIVNRLWKHMMGRGLVEPADDFRATNPASHPALLDKLADDFVAHGYRLRHTLRVIANSRTYARSVDATIENKNDDRFYSHAARRPLEPEVLADAISDVLGVAEKYGDEPKGRRAVALVSPRTESLTLDILGRCGREESCESSPGAISGLPQKLHLFNGGLLNARLSAEGSRLDQLLASGKRPLEIVHAFYLASLNRRPSDQEKQYWRDQLDTAQSADDQQACLEDFVGGS